MIKKYTTWRISRLEYISLSCQPSQPHLRPHRYPHYHPQLIDVNLCSETTTFSFTHYQHHPSATTKFIDEKPNVRQVITMAKKRKYVRQCATGVSNVLEHSWF